MRQQQHLLAQQPIEYHTHFNTNIISEEHLHLFQSYCFCNCHYTDFPSSSLMELLLIILSVVINKWLLLILSPCIIPEGKNEMKFSQQWWWLWYLKKSWALQPTRPNTDGKNEQSWLNLIQRISSTLQHNYSELYSMSYLTWNPTTACCCSSKQSIGK